MHKSIVPDIIATKQTLTTFGADVTVRQAARVMAERHIGAVLIMGNGKLEGIFTERDVLNRVVAPGKDPDTVKIGEVMTRDPDTVPPDATALDTLIRMQSKGYRHLPVVDDGQLVGIVSVRDLFNAVKRELEEDIQEREAFIFGATAAG
ncbi:MAG: CBS domain-containing protein [Alphaproteobacteria bacterium]|nr:CBS domain-containing protein [Alphaproteobacteria bacterium]